jgi:hypothetical protein
MNPTDRKDVTDIVEAGAITYALHKGKTDSDPIRGKDRIGGSPNVRSNGEYAAVAASHAVGGHFFAVIWVHLFGAWLLITFLGLAVLISHIDPSHGVVIALWVLYGYICVWRIGIKWPWSQLFKHGPNITFADGYRGPTGTARTVYSQKGIYEQNYNNMAWQQAYQQYYNTTRFTAGIPVDYNVWAWSQALTQANKVNDRDWIAANDRAIIKHKVTTRVVG